jgi:hypothetical protein
MSVDEVDCVAIAKPEVTIRHLARRAAQDGADGARRGSLIDSTALFPFRAREVAVIESPCGSPHCGHSDSPGARG